LKACPVAVVLLYFLDTLTAYLDEREQLIIMKKAEAALYRSPDFSVLSLLPGTLPFLWSPGYSDKY